MKLHPGKRLGRFRCGVGGFEGSRFGVAGLHSRVLGWEASRVQDSRYKSFSTANILP